MFQKIAKHRANDASNDVHRPPLFPLAPPLLLHCCVASFTFASFGKIHLGGHYYNGIYSHKKKTWLHCPQVQSPGFKPEFLEVGSLAPSLFPSGAFLSHLLQRFRRAKFT